MANQNLANQPQTPAPAKQKLAWGEKRDRRRRRRKVFEEVLGWIVVPAMIYSAYLIFQAVGGIPKELQDFAVEVFNTVTSGRL
jgi:hypothetical protein